MSERWFMALDATLDEVWRRLGRGVADRRAPARHPVLATAGAGGPEARVVVLRAAERAGATVEFHTDRRSGKIADLAGDPRAALVVWEARAHLQLRLRVHARVLDGAAAAERWARVPPAARGNYGGPVPGGPEAAPEEAGGAGLAAEEAFAPVLCRIDEIETLHLGRDRHRRAVFARAEGFAGRWVAP